MIMVFRRGVGHYFVDITGLEANSKEIAAFARNLKSLNGFVTEVLGLMDRLLYPHEPDSLNAIFPCWEVKTQADLDRYLTLSPPVRAAILREWEAHKSLGATETHFTGILKQMSSGLGNVARSRFSHIG